MNHETRIRQLLVTLPAQQKTLDFDDAGLWQQLPAGDRHACCDAIAALLCQVAKTTRDNNSFTNKDNNQHER